MPYPKGTSVGHTSDIGHWLAMTVDNRRQYVIALDTEYGSMSASKTFPLGEGADDSRRKRIAAEIQNSGSSQDGR